MIFHRITLHNFGIYANLTTFELKPKSDGQYAQPIVLLRGQNGVGKSTIVEAIRLCLHGKLALGARVTQREYEAYLDRRRHRDFHGTTAVRASVEIDFEHVILGKRHHYRVARSWSRQNNRMVIELLVWVDDQPNLGSEDEKEFLLRELVPPGVAELFFFDGEKIATLSETGEASNTLLADTVRNLLGLHLVDQLDRDLDIYLTRQTGIQELRQYQDELAQLHDEESKLVEARDSVRDQLADCRRKLQAQREAIGWQEQRIISEGGSYAEQQSEKEAKHQKINEAIAQVEQEIYELSRHLLPFAAAPRLMQAVRMRLEQESAWERWQASQPVIAEIETLILDNVTDAVNDAPAPTQKIRQLLQKHKEPPMPETAVIHRVSAEKRGLLLNWIDEALRTTPHQLTSLLRKRQQLQEAKAMISQDLERVPVERILRPLRDSLGQMFRDLGRLEAEHERLTAEEQRLTYHLERIAGSKRRVSEQIASIETDEDRIKLAARTKLLLAQYEQRLMAQKLAQLGEQLTKRLNQLSRKRNFIERVTIDAETFSVTLYRAGQPFPRAQLSAGEDQIFAIATLWALREVSGRPMPVIIDTPLSRLDDAHRRTMLAEFMPQVAQQVIVLATNVEIDDAAFSFLEPAISHAYVLNADNSVAQVQEQAIKYQPSTISPEEVTINAVK